MCPLFHAADGETAGIWICFYYILLQIRLSKREREKKKQPKVPSVSSKDYRFIHNGSLNFLSRRVTSWPSIFTHFRFSFELVSWSPSLPLRCTLTTHKQFVPSSSLNYTLHFFPPIPLHNPHLSHSPIVPSPHANRSTLTPNLPNPFTPTVSLPHFPPSLVHISLSILILLLLLLDRHLHAPSPTYINFILIATRLLGNFRREFVRSKWISVPIACIRRDTCIRRRPLSGGVR